MDKTHFIQYASRSEALMHLKTTNLCLFNLFGKQLEIGAAPTASDMYVSFAYILQ